MSDETKPKVEEEVKPKVEAKPKPEVNEKKKEAKLEKNKHLLAGYKGELVGLGEDPERKKQLIDKIADIEKQIEDLK